MDELMAERIRLMDEIDQRIRRVCDIDNSRAGIVGQLHNWLILADERFFTNGMVSNAGVSSLPRLEQPPYVSEMLVREAAGRWGVPYVPMEIRMMSDDEFAEFVDEGEDGE